MSKQLLHSCRSDVVVAALNDRAFALMIRDDDDALSLELLPPPPPPPAVSVSDNAPEEDVDGGDGDDGAARPTTEAAENPLEIQAVCCRGAGGAGGGGAWIAVSREDKTLSLYYRAATGRTDGAMEGDTVIRPTATYRVPRRARCLAFATVPSSSPSSSPSSDDDDEGDDGGGRLVVIVGDMSGDAWAFPVPSAAAAPSSSFEPPRRKLLLGHTASILTGLIVAPGADGNGGCGRRRGRSILLTADRDERVRVSLFPDAHVVRGYLLGHASFVSTMDAIAVPPDGGGGVGGGDRPPGGRTLCATGSGDGTVRLWDCASCREVGMVPVVVDGRRRPPPSPPASDDGAGGGDVGGGGDDDDEGTDGTDGAVDHEDGVDEEGGDDVGGSPRGDSDGGDDDDECDERVNAVAVPLSVALGPDAGCVIVARDGIPEIDVHPIPASPAPSSTSSLASLHEKQTLACPSQPLSVRCLSDGSVLALVAGGGAHGHLLHYRRNGGGSGSGSGRADGPFEDASSDSLFCASLRAALGSDVIDMPKSTLERDGCGGLKLRKTRVLDDHRGGGDDGGGDGDGGGSGGGGGGLHWNDAGRREVAKMRLQRRRKRRRERGKTEKVDGGD